MPLHEGETILNGKYRILKLIGEGGMARVWLAEEPRFSNRRVAIKEPREDLLPDDLAELRQRFQREVRVGSLLAQAKVPNIVQAITAEPYNDGLLLILEYMAGGSLTDLLREHPNGLPVERAVQITLDVLKALEDTHAHELEIVHRDIKPSNILFDASGVAHLGDFGLAQVAGMSEGRSRLRGGTHPGTPLYMAPEQERGGGYLSPAADIFALGCVLFEMLTGERYKRHRPGTPPSKVREAVPAWLDEIMTQALAEDPWDRWSSASVTAEVVQAGWDQAESSQQRQKLLEATRAAQAEQDWKTLRNAVAQLQALDPEAAVPFAEALAAHEQAVQTRQRARQITDEAQAAVDKQDWKALKRIVAELQALDREAAAPFAEALAAHEKEQARQEQLATWYQEAQRVAEEEPQRDLKPIWPIGQEAADFPDLASWFQRQAQATQRSQEAQSRQEEAHRKQKQRVTDSSARDLFPSPSGRSRLKGAIVNLIGLSLLAVVGVCILSTLIVPIIRQATQAVITRPPNPTSIPANPTSEPPAQQPLAGQLPVLTSGDTAIETVMSDALLVEHLASGATVDVAGIVANPNYGAVNESGFAVWEKALSDVYGGSTSDFSTLNVTIRYAISPDGHFYVGSVGSMSESLAVLIGYNKWWVPEVSLRNILLYRLVRLEYDSLQRDGHLTGGQGLSGPLDIWNKYGETIHILYSLLATAATYNSEYDHCPECFDIWDPSGPGPTSYTGDTWRKLNLSYSGNSHSFIYSRAYNDNSNSTYVKHDGVIVASRGTTIGADDDVRLDQYPVSIEMGGHRTWSELDASLHAIVVGGTISSSNHAEYPANGGNPAPSGLTIPPSGEVPRSHTSTP